MIRVVNKKTHKPTDNDIYVGRGSIFGNPFDFRNSSHPQILYHLSSRDECVESYKFYFQKFILDDEQFSDEVNRLIERNKRGEDINLVCYCAPKRCHGDVIKEYIEEQLWNS